MKTRSKIIFPMLLTVCLIANWSRVMLCGDGLKGEYFDNSDLSNLKVTRIDPQVNFDWGLKPPDPSIGQDTFSVRWTGQVEARFSELYQFYTFTDDGVRLWINGQLIINQWIDQKKENIGSITLLAGQRYNIQMEFYEAAGGATARLSWSSPSQPKQIIPPSQLYSSSTTAPPPAPSVSSVPPASPGSGNGLKGEYFDNSDLSNLKVTRIDPQVNFDWGVKSPDPLVAPDSFSVRWSGQVQARFSEVYKFYAFTDDGVRLWINGQLIVNQWIDQKKENIGSITLIAGQRYSIKMEFYEDGGGATAKLSWSSPSQPKQIIPQSQLYSSSSTTPPPPPPPPPSSGPFSWVTASPSSQGFNTAKLDIMRDVLATHKTQALLIVRNDRLVYEWYAPGRVATQNYAEASLAKSLVGSMSLALVLNDGSMGIDDLATKYISSWSKDSLKSKIRIRHLASHTSGIEDAEGPEAWKQAFWARDS